MQDYIQAIILGLVQGITEWLPISSSGHLVIMHHLFGYIPPAVYDALLHLSSLLALTYVYRSRIKELILGVINRDQDSLTYVGYLILATIPLAVFGMVFSDWILSVFYNITFVGFAFLVSFVVLYFTQYAKATKVLTVKSVLGVGLAQMFAIFPGVSRSGITVSSALLMGVKKSDALMFSFFLAYPAILGATLFELDTITQIPNYAALFVAMVTTVLSGVLTLNWLIKLVEKGKLHYFAYYCLVVGILCLVV